MIPDWVIYLQITSSYMTKLKPCICERCTFEWYPRINPFGKMNIHTCPKCKSKLWDKPKILHPRDYT